MSCETGDMDPETAATAFSAADVDFIQHLLETLRRDIVRGRDYGGLLTILSCRLECFQKAVTNAASLQQLPAFSPFVCTVTPYRSAGAPSKIRVTGPLLDLDLEVTAKSPEDSPVIVRRICVTP